MWREQWERVLRYYELLRSINEGRAHDRASDHYQDEVYAFFQNCYHLKDWLKNDPDTAVVLAKPNIEDWVNSKPNISLCADLANGSKHLNLTKPRSGNPTSVGRREYQLDLGGAGGSIIRVRYEVDSGGRAYDAFALATACIEDWRQYLAGMGLV